MSAEPFVALRGPIYRSLYFATVMSSGFYGITCMQAFFYYVHYRNDPLLMKSLVAVVWAVNTIHEALTCSGSSYSTRITLVLVHITSQIAYKYITAGQENLLSTLKGIPELVGLASIATQGFFVYRIYLFNGRNIFGPLIWVPLSIYQSGEIFQPCGEENLTGSIWVLVAVLLYVTKALYIADGLRVIDFFLLNEPLFINMASSSLCVAVAVDVTIAVVLTFLLVRERIATGFANTAHILQRLTVFVVNSGIWTATFAILSLFFLHFYPVNLFHTVFSFPLCSVYCNTLLANLNARAYIRGETTTTDTDAHLFTTATSQAFDGTRSSDKHRGSRVVSFRTSGRVSQSMIPMTIVTIANEEDHGGVTPVGNRPTSTSEIACV
ncbi:hypothetical protein HD554DRAFT_2270339 [Boletus coccyginus]|nr:hypothetical protein HD554DRAFT_2270339 [Boletus coccyginus]